VTKVVGAKESLKRKECVKLILHYLALLILTDIHVPFVSSLGPISQPAVEQLTGFSTVSSKTENNSA
jgi:hypothetical protein